jgi:uncharacterized protein DUF1116
MTEQVVVRRGAFHDPVTLMAAAREAWAVDGVQQVAVGMADPLNLTIIRGRHGYDLAGHDAPGPEDLVIALRAETDAVAEEALGVVERFLAARRGVYEVVDVGPYVFAGELRGEPVQRIDWRAGQAGAGADLALLEPRADAIARANDHAVARMQEARPLLVGVAVARDVLPGMTDRTLLHAGPPIEWADMTGPMRGAVIGAALLEGLADDAEDAVRKAEAGAFEFAPGHERGALGPMAGVISASMPVWAVENDAHGNRAYCTLSEGLGGPFRFGAFDPSVIERLRWMRAVLAPIVGSALARLPAPLDLRAITADALEMGDEVHNRPPAGTSLVFRALAPTLMEADGASTDILDVARYMAGDDFMYLSLSMAGGKATADAAAGIEDSTIVTTMARNGTEFGLRMSGTGDRWFTAPSSRIQAVFHPGYRHQDANPDLGDSTITETTGLGGFAWAAAPAIGHFAGVSAEDALRATLAMYDITWAESEHYRIPALGYRGTPVGIDCRKVVATGIPPVADTGVAHREAGVGKVGGGFVRPPMAPFAAAVQALAGAG